MRLNALDCIGFSPAPERLRLHYRVAGTVRGPNDELAHIDVAESDDEIFVSIFESVRPGDKYLAGLFECVDISIELHDRVVRDGNAPRADERRGARLYLQGALVPRRPYEWRGSTCHDWTSAAWEPRVGPQKWPSGTVHRRFLAPA